MRSSIFFCALFVAASASAVPAKRDGTTDCGGEADSNTDNAVEASNYLIDLNDTQCCNSAAPGCSLMHQTGNAFVWLCTTTTANACGSCADAGNALQNLADKCSREGFTGGTVTFPEAAPDAVLAFTSGQIPDGF